MRPGRFCARQSWRRELLPLASVFAVLTILGFTFPYGLFSFQASETSDYPAVASCAFVWLSPEAEKAALAAARSSWQTDAREIRGLRVEMFAEPLPKPEIRPVLAFADRPRETFLPLVPYSFTFFSPTLAAPPPRVILKKEEPPAQSVFPFEEMIAMPK